mgnify:CR=1 FL=1
MHDALALGPGHARLGTLRGSCCYCCCWQRPLALGPGQARLGTTAVALLLLLLHRNPQSVQMCMFGCKQSHKQKTAWAASCPGWTSSCIAKVDASVSCGCCMQSLANKPSGPHLWLVTPTRWGGGGVPRDGLATHTPAKCCDCREPRQRLTSRTANTLLPGDGQHPDQASIGSRLARELVCGSFGCMM